MFKNNYKGMHGSLSQRLGKISPKKGYLNRGGTREREWESIGGRGAPPSWHLLGRKEHLELREMK